MNNTSIPKLMYDYTPTSIRDVGWPRNSWRAWQVEEAWNGLYPVTGVGDDDNTAWNNIYY
jgi:hypothetical protein